MRAGPFVRSTFAQIIAIWRDWVDRQALRWGLYGPICLAFGAAAYLVSPVEPPVWAPLTGLSAAVLIWLGVRRAGGVAAFVALMLVWMLGGASIAQIRSLGVAAPVLLDRIGPARVEGVVVAIDAGRSSLRIEIEVTAIEGVPREMTPRYVRISHRDAIVVGPGRSVTCRAILNPPPAPASPGDYPFSRDAWFRQLGAVGFAVGRCDPLATPPSGDPLDRAGLWVAAIRRAMASEVRAAAPSDGGAIATALIVGDRSYISPEDAESLRASGLAHLLAISGLHMVLVGGAVFALVRWTWPLAEPLALRVPTVRVAALAAIVACTLYFFVSGGAVSAQRAYVMALVGFGAKLFDQPAISIRSLATSMTLVLLMHPEAVVTPGFQMSFAASGALIALFEIWRARPATGNLSRAIAWIAGLAATSIAASTATAPFALYHFDRSAALSIPANMVASPIVAFWTTPSAIAAGLSAPFGLSEPFLRSMAASLDAVLMIARFTEANSPLIDFPRLGAAAMLFSGVAIALFCIHRGPYRALALMPAILAAGLWLNGGRTVAIVANNGEVFLRQPGGWASVSIWMSQSGLDPLAVDSAVTRWTCNPTKDACSLDAGGAQFRLIGSMSDEIAAASGRSRPSGEPCPASVVLEYRVPDPNIAPRRVAPCEFIGRGGVVIEALEQGNRLRTGSRDGLRPWSPRRIGDQ